MQENGDMTRTVIEFLFTRQRQTYLAFAKSLVHDEEALGVSHSAIDHTLRRVLRRLSLALKDYGPQIAVIVAGINIV